MGVLARDYADQGGVLAALLLPDVWVVLRLRVDLVAVGLAFSGTACVVKLL